LATAALAASTFATQAAAQEPDKADLARARTAFQEAVALAAANNCAAALAKYKEVAQVKMTPQVAFNTAECEARLGKLVSALGNYRIAASQAADDKRAAAVLKETPARIEELEVRIPKLTVTRARGADTASIELDGTELGQTQLGNAIPVDPGAHTIVAKVGGKPFLRETVKLDEKQAKTFEVRINSDAPLAEASSAAETPPPDQTPPKPEEEKKSRVPGVVLTVGGGAVMIAGFAMLAPRQSAINQLSNDCTPSGHCPVGDQSVANSGKLYTGLTEVMVPVGAVAAITGIVLIAKNAPSKPKRDTTEEKKEGDGDKKDAFWRSIKLLPAAPGANVGGLGVTGRF
jgi:hypothetical protein